MLDSLSGYSVRGMVTPLSIVQAPVETPSTSQPLALAASVDVGSVSIAGKVAAGWLGGMTLALVGFYAWTRTHQM